MAMSQKSEIAGRAVLYCRYSSHAQREVSIDQQIAACRSFADRLGISILKIYEDHALSGTSDRRPAFQRMISEAAELDYQYVIVYSLDRFARDRYDSAVYKRQLRQHGKRVISATENISDDPSGGLLEAMLEALAEYYSKELAQKIRRGMEDNAARCMVVGALPYGYKKGDDGRYAIDELQAQVVREIFIRVLAGDKLIHIAEDLNSRGFRTKTGAPWGRSSFNSLLSNERYTGVYIYQDKRIEGGVPQIVERELFDAVQHVLHTKKNPRAAGPQRRRRDNEIYLLTGKLFCGECESPMVGISGTSKSKRMHHYYVCKGHRSGSSCALKPVRRDAIERAVAAAIKEKILTPEVIEQIADLTMQAIAEEGPSQDLEILRDELTATDKGIANIVKVVEAGTASAALLQRLDILEARTTEIREQLAYLERKQGDPVTREDIVAAMYLFADGEVDSKAYQEAPFDAFLLRAYVFGDHMRLIFSVFGDEVDLSGVRISGQEAHHVPLYEHQGKIIPLKKGVYALSCGF